MRPTTTTTGEQQSSTSSTGSASVIGTSSPTSLVLNTQPPLGQRLRPKWRRA
jgi:hypothetical protein